MINLYLVNDTYESLTITTSKYGECNMRSRNCIPLWRIRLYPRSRFLMGFVLLIFIVVCVVQLHVCVFTLLVQCCYIRYDFRIKVMFDLSLPLVNCIRGPVLFTLYMCLFAHCGLFLFCLSLASALMPVYLDCHFLLLLRGSLTLIHIQPVSCVTSKRKLKKVYIR